MGVIRDILSQVDAAVDTVAQDGFVSSAGAVGDVISAGAALLVVLRKGGSWPTVLFLGLGLEVA